LRSAADGARRRADAAQEKHTALVTTVDSLEQTAKKAEAKAEKTSAQAEAKEKEHASARATLATWAKKARIDLDEPPEETRLARSHNRPSRRTKRMRTRSARS
jgi:hypothetical protein